MSIFTFHFQPGITGHYALVGCKTVSCFDVLTLTSHFHHRITEHCLPYWTPCMHRCQNVCCFSVFVLTHHFQCGIAETVPCSDWALSKCRCPGACCEWFLCEHPYLPLPEWHRRTLCPPRWTPRRCRCQRACCEPSVLPVTAARSCSGSKSTNKSTNLPSIFGKGGNWRKNQPPDCPTGKSDCVDTEHKHWRSQIPQKTAAFFWRQSTPLAIWTYGTNPYLFPILIPFMPDQYYSAHPQL